MIHTIKGNLLDETSGILLHGCNLQGVMGSGIAKQIKDKYPGCFEMYRSACKNLSGGDVVFYVHSPDLYIANAITQDRYGTDKRHVNYVWIAKVFDTAISVAYHRNLPLKFPMVGAGLAGGDWSIIKQIINDCDPKDTVRKELFML